jgi:hypothetical protein
MLHEKDYPDAIVACVIHPPTNAGQEPTFTWKTDMVAEAVGSLLGPNGISWPTLAYFIKDVAHKYPLQGSLADFDDFLRALTRANTDDKTVIQWRINSYFSRSYPVDIMSKFDKLKADLNLAEAARSQAESSLRHTHEEAHKAILQAEDRGNSLHTALLACCFLLKYFLPRQVLGR